MNELELKIKKYMEEIERDNLFFSQLWKIENEEDREEIELYFAEYVLELVKGGTRYNSNNRRILDYMNKWDTLRIMRRYGIFGRVYCREYNNKIIMNYCVGQDYTSERKCMRDLLVRG